MSVSSIEQQIIDEVAAGLRHRLRGLQADQAQQIDPAWVAAAMLDAVPTAHPWEKLGPFYDSAGLTAWQGITRQALHQKVKHHQILAPTTGNGQRVYPAWQFTPDGRIVPGLVDVLRILLPTSDEWTVALWLTTATSRFNDHSALDLLLAGDQTGAVKNAALEDAERWAA